MWDCTGHEKVHVQSMNSIKKMTCSMVVQTAEFTHFTLLRTSSTQYFSLPIPYFSVAVRITSKLGVVKFCRSRRCNNPIPLDGGYDCDGDNFEEKEEACTAAKKSCE